jgi:hypothetical protein
MDFNVYLGLLVEVDGATLISTILLVDVKMESFSSYKYVPTPWAKHTNLTEPSEIPLDTGSATVLYHGVRIHHPIGGYAHVVLPPGGIKSNIFATGCQPTTVGPPDSSAIRSTAATRAYP